MEEVGVKVGKITYHSSQPWPFPCSLMIGLIGHAITDEFKRSLKEHGLKVFHGDDASIQPGSSGDRWPRETSVS